MPDASPLARLAGDPLPASELRKLIRRAAVEKGVRVFLASDLKEMPADVRRTIETQFDKINRTG